MIINDCRAAQDFAGVGLGRRAICRPGSIAGIMREKPIRRRAHARVLEEARLRSGLRGEWQAGLRL